MTGTGLDGHGRPVVVVTGLGVLTSLGEGVSDNWARLTAGHSGIRRITRFPLDGLRTTVAGAVDFVDVPDASSVALAALAVGHGRLFPPLEPAEKAMDTELRQALVTGWGHWRGEAMALVTAA